MKETVSALYDGELESVEMDELCIRLKDEPELRQAWNTYSLIGDALRGMPSGSLPAEFRSRLDAEPTVLAPRARVTPITPRRATRIAVSAAAGVAAVAFVGMTVFQTTMQQSPPSAAIVTAPVQAPAVSAPPVVADATTPVQRAPETRSSSPAVRDYLLAHQRFSPALALQGAAPFVRTVSDDQTASAR
jgi:sigma-E factor negative regulatory protein RseA